MTTVPAVGHQATRPRVRWFQFTIRRSLVLLTLTGLVLWGWLQVLQQRSALVQLHAAGTGITEERLRRWRRFPALELLVLGDTDAAYRNLGRKGGGLLMVGSRQSLTTKRSMSVGDAGPGSLIVGGGSLFKVADWCEVADAPKSSGRVTVRDGGTRWEIASWVELAERGRGELTISGGAVVEMKNHVSLAGSRGSIATVTVSGAKSQWKVASHFTAGEKGEAEIIIRDGGQLASGSWADVGAGRSSKARVNLLGADSRWDVQAAVSIGENGNGQVTVGGGASFQNGNWAAIGRYATGDGLVAVKGSGSSWTIGNYASIGSAGKGSLTIADGGSVLAKSRLTLGKYPSGRGRITVDERSSLSVASHLYLATDGQALLELSGGRVNAGRIEVGKRGAIRGTGRIKADVENGGTIEVRDVMTVAGDYSQQSSGRLVFKLGNRSRGKLRISGRAGLDGVVTLQLKEGAQPPGKRLEVLSAGKISGRFQKLVTPKAGRWQLEYSDTGVFLVAGD